MPREFSGLPLFWQDAVPSNVQAMVTARRHRYVANSKALEEEGFRPVTQVTMRSGRLLRRGDPFLRYMVEGAIRNQEEARIRDISGGKDIEFRSARGTVVPLVDPREIRESKHFLGSWEGFTLYMREMPPKLPEELFEELEPDLLRELFMLQ